MKFNVTDIEFDFDDGNDGESYALTFDEEIAIRDLALGVWEADDEDDMMDEITTATGYLIKNITSTFNSNDKLLQRKQDETWS